MGQISAKGVPDRERPILKDFLVWHTAKCPISGNYFTKCAVLEFMSDVYKAGANWEETSKDKCRFERQGSKGEGYVRVGDQEYQVEAESSVVVPPGTRHCFGLHGPGIIKAFAVLGHRVFKEGSEPPDLPPPNR